MILRSNTVRRQKVDDLIRRESSVSKTCENRVDRILWFRNSLVRSREREVGAASQELKSRTAGTIGHANGTSELDAVRVAKLISNTYINVEDYVQVAEGDAMFDRNGTLLFDDVVHAVVGRC